MRTVLANDRTLLAYVRTALALAGVGAFVFKFFDAAIAVSISAMLLLCAFSVLVFGFIRYRSFHRRIISRNGNINQS